MNTTHPELEEGEVFITNVVKADSKDYLHAPFDGWSKYSDIGWETKRAGTIAYTIGGKIIKNAYPVFIQLKEYEDKYGKGNIE